MKRIIYILSFLIVLAGCQKDNKNDNAQDNVSSSNQIENSSEMEDKSMELNQIAGYQEGNIKAKIHTNMGEMDVILFPNVAPKAVENFVTHAKEGYYENVTFHRVIEDFMIQGGDPTGTGAGGESIWGNDFEDEFDINYRNFYGALSMANAGPSTNGSQFFIVTTKNNVNSNLIQQMRDLGEEAGYPEPVIEAYEKIGGAFHLDFKHTVFGQVVKGMEVAENISKVETDSMDKPVEDVIIEKIEVKE